MRMFAPSAVGVSSARWRSALPDKTIRQSASPRAVSWRFLRDTPAMPRSFDVDCDAHPRMNTALKMMFALRETRDLQLAALKDTSPGHRDVLKAAGTLGNRRLSSIEAPDYSGAPYETAPEFRHLGEGVRLTTLVHYDKGGSFPDRDAVGLEVPALVWMSSRRLRK